MATNHIVKGAAMLAVALASSFGVRGQTTIFSETFEGIFPDASWSVGDANSSGVPAFWDDVDLTFFGSPSPRTRWAGYCAGTGHAGTEFAPLYRSSMSARMQRTVNLAGFTSAELTFWYDIPSIEEEFDFLIVEVDGSEIWSTTEATFNWTQIALNLDAYVGGSHTIAFRFFSDGSVEGEGAYLDDIVLSASGDVQAPNLTPYRPDGWSDKIVVSTVTGTTTDAAVLNPGENLYVDWAVINDGSVATPAGFTTELYVDDVLERSFPRSTALPANGITGISDYNIGDLPAGPHTIKIRTDSANEVTESSETDNEYIKNIVIAGEPEIRISPLSVSFNITNTLAPAPSADVEQVSFSAEQKLLAASDLLARLDNGEKEVRVIVNLAPPAGKPRGAEWNSPQASQAWRRAVKLRQEEVLSLLDPVEFKLKHRFENQSSFSGMVSRKGLEKLARHPRVTVIEPSRQLERHLAQGISLMKAGVYRSSYNGAGVSVAIADSGVDYNHPRLGGGGFPNSKVIGGYDFGSNDADPAPEGDDAHGTACAGIAAGDLGTVVDYIGGVAPSAKIYALKITAGGSAFDDDILASWDWCISHKNDDPANPIVVISTSFGADRYFSTCDNSQASYATAANDLIAAGITVLVSSGNNGFCDSMASPACISTVISVGAVFDANFGTIGFCIDDASCVPKTPDGACPSGWETTQATGPDVVTRYSNTAGFLTLLAPSHQAYTTDIVGSSGYSSGDYATGFGGTSAASPYVAGAVAVLQSAAQSLIGRLLTPVEIREKLTSTGDLVTDTKAAVTTPRVNLGRAIETFGQNNSFTIFNDGNAPLTVSSISVDAESPWLTWTPDAPLVIPPGTAQIIGLSLNPALVPPDVTIRRILVASDDADESPYPDGVFINVTNVAARPILRATRAADRILLHWPADASGFVLQAAANLTGAPWQNVPTEQAIVGNEIFVTNSLAATMRFYRLRR
jgi:subtilisin family serine protease